MKQVDDKINRVVLENFELTVEQTRIANISFNLHFKMQFKTEILQYLQFAFLCKLE